MRLEVRIPGSPLPHYYNRVRIIARSVREFYPDAVVRFYVGSEEELLLPSSPGVECLPVPRGAFLQWKGTAHPYIATMMQRFKPPFTGTHVLMLDADVIMTGRIDELFAVPALSAVMAHVPPFDPARWRQLYFMAGLAFPSFEHELSGWGTMFNDPAVRYSPPYFNTGVVFAPAWILETLYESYMAELMRIKSVMDSYFFEQIALTLALEKARLPVNVLPLRYNFPNQPEFDRAHPEELADVRLLHFLRTDTVSREADFESPESIARLVGRVDLSGSNEVFRRRVGGLAA